MMGAVNRTHRRARLTQQLNKHLRKVNDLLKQYGLKVRVLEKDCPLVAIPNTETTISKMETVEK